MLSDYIFYKIANKAEFLALELPSQEIEVILEDVGLKTILLTSGNEVGVFYDEVFLCPVNDRNPFEFDGYALWIDENDDIWLGIEKDD